MRPRPFLAVVTACAVLVAGCGIDDPYQSDAPTTTSTQTTPAAAVTTPAATATGPDAHEVRPDLSPAQATARRDAERVARHFLAGYLPYSYGRRSAATISDATGKLRRELGDNPPRVSGARARAARPRVRRLRATGVSADRVFVFAQVADRRSRYATSLTIVRRHGHWLVSEVR